MTTASRLKNLMEQHSVGVVELAKRAGLWPSEVSRLRSGERSPTTRQLRALKRAFPGVNADWFLDSGAEKRHGAKR